MKTSSKTWACWAIVWTIFLFVLLSMLAWSIPETLKVMKPDTRSKEAASDRPYTIQTPIQTVEPIETAESLQGKELYRFYVAQIHEQYYPDVDPYIALAVLETESNYQPNVKSKVGAVGLMQVIPKYHFWRVEKYGLNDIWDPYTNIICGMDFLNDLIHTRGRWDLALLGYNNSWSYVNHVLLISESLKAGDCFG